MTTGPPSAKARSSAGRTSSGSVGAQAEGPEALGVGDEVGVAQVGRDRAVGTEALLLDPFHVAVGAVVEHAA